MSWRTTERIKYREALNMIWEFFFIKIRSIFILRKPWSMGFWHTMRVCLFPFEYSSIKWNLFKNILSRLTYDLWAPPIECCLCKLLFPSVARIFYHNYNIWSEASRAKTQILNTWALQLNLQPKTYRIFQYFSREKRWNKFDQSLIELL